MNTCQWVKANKSICEASCKGDYCYAHAPLALIGYKRTSDISTKTKPFVVVPKPKPEALDGTMETRLDMTAVGETDDLPPTNIDDMRRQWRSELDEEFSGNTKGKTYSAKDFPQLINGLMFSDIEEYKDYCEGLELMSRNKKNKKHNRGHNSQFGFYSSSSLPSTYVEKKPTKQDERLKRGWYQRIDSIMHMRYILFRDKDGWYYAIFMSIWAKEDQDEALKTLIRKVAETQLPLLRPVQVEGVGQFHATGPFYTWSGAEAKFSGGGESLSRIRERIRKAADPKYIPPNLRKMAIAATYDGAVWELIPAFEHERLKKWLADDCPGWFGQPPKGGYKHKTDNWSSGGSYYSGKQSSLVPTVLPQTATAKDFKGKAPDGFVWDHGRQRWVKRTV